MLPSTLTLLALIAAIEEKSTANDELRRSVPTPEEAEEVEVTEAVVLPALSGVLMFSLEPSLSSEVSAARPRRRPPEGASS